ncbi:putative membrane protein [Arthrobacter sp. B3I4]|nr:putative membrane protein [Arthrobacter sp. B3I4]
MGVSDLSVPLRVARAIGESPLSERVAAAQDLVYGPVLRWAQRSAFHTDVLGHSIHPPLTDLTLGCWISAAILDVAGKPQDRHGATLLVAAGLAAAVPTAFAGASDWAGMTGTDRRIGAVHGLGTDAAVFLLLGSLIARTRGRHSLGVQLGLAGNAVMAGTGFLGGHLALNRGTARRTPA